MAKYDNSTQKKYNEDYEDKSKGETKKGEPKYEDQKTNKGFKVYDNKKSEYTDSKSSEYSGKGSKYAVEQDQTSKKWMLHPFAESGSSYDYAIEFDSRDEADRYKKELFEGKVKSPTEAPSMYKFLRNYTNGKYKIYGRL